MRKKISGIDFEKLIIPGAVVIGGYLILKNFNLLGGGDSSANSDLITANTSATVASDLQKSKNAGNSQTISDSTLSGLADSIYNAGVVSSPDQDSIVYMVIQANTLTDLLRMVQLFGTRKANDAYFSTCNFFNFNCPSYSLTSFLRAVLDAGHLQTINGYLSQQGINYTF